MLCQDILEVLKFQAAARNRAVLTGSLDTAMWLCWFASSSIAIGSDAKHGLTAGTLTIIGAVSLANFIGSMTGALIGERFIREDPA